MTNPTRLVNHFLVAMPSMDDPQFARSVVYLFDHNHFGAAGFIVNKPSKTLLTDLLKRMDLKLGREDLHKVHAFDGGPVHQERGFVLHPPTQAYDFEVDDEAKNDAMRMVVRPSEDEFYAATVAVRGGLEITTSRDVMEAVAEGVGPPKLLVCCGYASWVGLQLESEIAANDWFVVPANQKNIEQIVFDTPIADRYKAALALMGLEEWMLATQHKVII